MAALLRDFANAVGLMEYVPEDGYLPLHWTAVPMTGPEFRARYMHAHNLLRCRHPHTSMTKDKIGRSVTTEFFEEVAPAAAWLRAA